MIGRGRPVRRLRRLQLHVDVKPCAASLRLPAFRNPGWCSTTASRRGPTEALRRFLLEFAVSAVHARLEESRQDRFDRKRVYIHNATADLATLTVSGPAGRCSSGSRSVSISPTASCRTWRSPRASSRRRSSRRARQLHRRSKVSTLRSRRQGGPALGAAARNGQDLDAILIGVEALTILRAEKGYFVIGKDTDGTTMPHEWGRRPARQAIDGIRRATLAVHRRGEAARTASNSSGSSSPTANHRSPPARTASNARGERCAAWAS